MRRAIATVAFSAILASGAASFTLLPDASEVEARPAQGTFLVSADDGYGLGDCLTSGAECGRVVANAWCETHGFARAVTFDLVKPEDVTATVQTVSTSTRERAVSITCAS
jgi:hypothetical protein